MSSLNEHCPVGHRTHPQDPVDTVNEYSTPAVILYPLDFCL